MVLHNFPFLDGDIFSVNELSHQSIKYFNFELINRLFGRWPGLIELRPKILIVRIYHVSHTARKNSCHKELKHPENSEVQFFHEDFGLLK